MRNYYTPQMVKMTVVIHCLERKIADGRLTMTQANARLNRWWRFQQRLPK